MPSMNMTTLDKLKVLYESAPERCMYADLGYAINYGHVWSEPGRLLIAWRAEDAWYIHVAIGDNSFRWFCQQMPYYLPYIGWGRQAKGRKTVRWHMTEKIFRKFNVPMPANK